MKVSKKQCVDTGMALVLVCLLLHVLLDQRIYMPELAIVILLVSMIAPVILKPLAYIWFGMSTLLGGVMSRLLLSVIFCVVLVPVGLVVKVFRKDPFKLKEFDAGQGSLFVDRQHTFDKSDLDHPY